MNNHNTEDPGQDTKAHRRSALQQGLHYLSCRRVSVWEMDQRLQRARYPQEEREQAILNLQEWKYLDDGEFARAYCRGKKERSSRKKVAYELGRKGVSGEDIARALDQEYSEEEEMEYCRQHMFKVWDKMSVEYSSKQNWNYLVEAFKGRIARKGYPCAGIQKIVEEEPGLFFPDTAKET
ncbi:MAG: RecX family transcriptional regulator [Peptococcaceae bacterium]|nr:RecX family transcriptional regulator [Peptococcaceae bacterium]